MKKRRRKPGYFCGARMGCLKRERKSIGRKAQAADLLPAELTERGGAEVTLGEPPGAVGGWLPCL